MYLLVPGLFLGSSSKPNVFLTHACVTVDFIDGRCDVCLTKFEVSHWSALHGGAPLAVKFAPKKKFGIECRLELVELKHVGIVA